MNTRPVLTPFERYKELLLELHDLIAEGRGNTPGANKVRQAMEGPERDLTEDEIELLDGLSADLYMLRGKEIFEPLAPDESIADIAMKFSSARREHNWSDVLALLRKDVPEITEALRAYLRAVAYDKLGEVDVALSFMLYAVAQNPTHVPSRYYVLDYFIQLGDFASALEYARKYVTEANAPPPLLIMQAYAMVKATEVISNPRAAQKYFINALDVLKRALSDAKGAEGTPRHTIVLGYLTMGYAFENVGDPVQAERAYKLALQVDPKNEDATEALSNPRIQTEKMPLLFEMEAPTEAAIASPELAGYTESIEQFFEVAA